MLGDENSTMIFFLLSSDSPAAGSFRPELGFVPYALVDRRISGMTLLINGWGLKKNWTNGPAWLTVINVSSVLGNLDTISSARSWGFLPLTRNAGTGNVKSPFSSVGVHCSRGMISSTFRSTMGAKISARYWR